MRLFVCAAIIPISLLLTSCSARGPVFTPKTMQSSDAANLYIYRPKSSTLSARTALISIDGKAVAKINNNGFVSTNITPGDHIITFQWTKWFLIDSMDHTKIITMPVNISSDQNTYIRLSSSSESSVTGINTTDLTIYWELENVKSEQALKEIAFCNRQKLVAQ